MKQTPLPNTLVHEGRIPKFYTKSLTPGIRFFDQEFTRREGGVEYREVNPQRSKLVAALAKGCTTFGIEEGGVVLYLGASHGYTPSFVSDMVGAKGLVYCVEFAPTVARDLVFVCEARKNMIPILADANQPDAYAPRITAVDVVFQDISQRDQAGIFLKNLAFLKHGGIGLLALKARSVDSSKPPREIFRRIRAELAAHVEILEEGVLEPFEKDHAFFVVRKN